MAIIIRLDEAEYLNLDHVTYVVKFPSGRVRVHMTDDANIEVNADRLTLDGARAELLLEALEVGCHNRRNYAARAKSKETPP